MTSEAAPQPQPAPLPERVQQVLDATSGHTAGPWTYNEGSICHGYEVRDGKRTATWIADIDHQNQDDYADDGYHSYSPQADRDAALIAAAPTLRALLAETAAALAAAEAREEALRAALAHYAELRHYDYAGRLWSGNPDEHEDAQVDFGEIARAALAQAGGESL